MFKKSFPYFAALFIASSALVSSSSIFADDDAVVPSDIQADNVEDMDDDVIHSSDDQPNDEKDMDDDVIHPSDDQEDDAVVPSSIQENEDSASE